MTHKIAKKIVSFKVKKEEENKVEEPKAPEREHMHENVERPELLLGSTYKIKTPHSEHALYVTINDVILNQGTDHEVRQPYEVFINSKNMDHFQWVVALTRVIS
ncbi:MAG: NrdJb, partial [Gammaproteobacteria bacterium]|nr:NrdJb [Gammaproteobacteria bacterium]